MLTMVVQFDGFPRETSVVLEDVTSSPPRAILQAPSSAVGVFEKWNQSVTVATTNDEDYLLVIQDPDGMQGGSFTGWVQIYVDQKLILVVGGDFENQVVQSLMISGSSMVVIGNPPPIALMDGSTLAVVFVFASEWWW